MKKFASIGLVLAFFLLDSSLIAESVLTVSVQKTQIRTKPSFLGKPVASASYGEEVSVLGKKGGWTQVKTKSGKSGWISTAALTDEKIELSAKSGNVDKYASQSEVALAGRGFNKSVEAQYKSANDLDYTWVDRAESYGDSPEELVQFLTSAGLKVPGEGENQ